MEEATTRLREAVYLGEDTTDAVADLVRACNGPLNTDETDKVRH